MPTSLGQQLLACGRHSLPQSIVVRGRSYSLIRAFKHDFFAATALYKVDDACASGDTSSDVAERVVLKLARRADLFGLPLAWLGRVLCAHECGILRQLEGMQNVPQLIACYGHHGLVYRYIEGESLDEAPAIPDDFFDRLADLLDCIHRRNIAYLDMNKRGNILIDDGGRPHLIDFQISWRFGRRLLGSKRLAGLVFDWLKSEDYYHLLKHKRRLRRDLMDREQVRQSRRVSSQIGLYRRITRPFTRCRRAILAYLFRTGHIAWDESNGRSPENDPSRWAE